MEQESAQARAEQRKDSLLVSAVVVAALALIVAVVAVGFSLRAVDESEVTAGGGGGGASTVMVMLSEYKIDPATINVAAGGTLDVMNQGTQQHNLAVEGEDLTTANLNSGDRESLSLGDLDPGTYTMLCTIPGHADLGMRGSLVVGEGDGGTAAGDGTTATTQKWTPEAMDASAKARVKAFPAATKGEGGLPLEPTIAADGAKEWSITVEEIDWEVEPGRVVKAMAYNGQVPGPTLRTEVGDRVRVTFLNKLRESTTIHFHGIDVPNEMDGVPDVTQEQIKVGESFTYAFDITEPAVGMYHAHSNSQHQVPMGLMAGMINSQMPLPGGIAPSQEIPFILNDAGEMGFTINGKAFPATKPVIAKIGEPILVHYYNEGLQIHPMHLHGPDQLVVAKDGNPLPQPYRADTVNVAPGERYSVLVTPNRSGTWVWHCHILTHAEGPQGFLGMVTALVVE